MHAQLARLTRRSLQTNRFQRHFNLRSNFKHTERFYSTNAPQTRSWAPWGRALFTGIVVAVIVSSAGHFVDYVEQIKSSEDKAHTYASPAQLKKAIHELQHELPGEGQVLINED